MGILDEMFPSESGDVKDLLGELGQSVPTPPLIQWAEEQILEDEADNSGYGGYIMDGFHPSFIAHTDCLNAMYLHRTEHERETFFAKTHRIFQNGNDYHTRIQRHLRKHLLGTWKCRDCHSVINENIKYLDWIEKTQTHEDCLKAIKPVKTLSDNPVPIPSECPSCQGIDFKYMEWRVIDPETQITGKIDGIIEYQGVMFGFEAKSANFNSFKSLGYGTPLFKKYERQFSLYLNSLGFQYGIIYIENKNDQSEKVFTINVNDAAIQEFLKPTVSTMEKVNHHLQIGSVPMPVRNKDCKDCMYAGGLCLPENK